MARPQENIQDADQRSGDPCLLKARLDLAQGDAVALPLCTEMKHEIDRGRPLATSDLFDDKRIKDWDQQGPLEVQHLRGDSMVAVRP